MHRAWLAHLELLNCVNESPRMICMVQEPYTHGGKFVTKPKGMEVFPSSYEDYVPRTAIYVPLTLRATELPHLCRRDCTAVLLRRGDSCILAASVYLDIQQPVQQAWLIELLTYAESGGYGVVLSVDTNSHSELFGPDSNDRGAQLEDLIFHQGLSVENSDMTPTFQTTQRSSCIDVTFTRGLPPGSVANWKVDTSFNGSDHNSIYFSILQGFEYISPTRPWARADWPMFTDVLRAVRIYVPYTLTLKNWTSSSRRSTQPSILP